MPQSSLNIDTSYVRKDLQRLMEAHNREFTKAYVRDEQEVIRKNQQEILQDAAGVAQDFMDGLGLLKNLFLAGEPLDAGYFKELNDGFFQIELNGRSIASIVL